MLKEHGFEELQLERGTYVYRGSKGIEAIIHSHVDGCLTVCREGSQAAKEIDNIAVRLHMSSKDSSYVVYCGKRIHNLPQ